MEQLRENKMGTMPVFRLIVTMSVPAILSMMVQALYNIVDSYFVAKISENALTAVSLVFPVQVLLIAVAVGTAVGLNSLIARRLGENRRQEADSAATHGILLGIGNGILFLLIGLFCSRLFLSAFTKIPEIVSMGTSYMRIVCIFSIGVCVEINIEKTLQATGSMIYPMVFQLIGAVCNIILDPIFIFGLFGMPVMGVAGAAIATVIAQFLSLATSMTVLLTQEHEVRVSFRQFRPNGQILKSIYAVGLPAIFMQSAGSLMVVGMNAILIGFTETAVAVFGAYFKLQSFIFMPVFGLTQGIMPVVGYNFGAKKRERLLSAVRIGSLFALVILGFGTLLFNLLPDKLLLIFSASDHMLRIGVPALRTISICFLPAALGIVFSTTFQAVGDGVKSLFISLLRQIAVLLPSAYFLSGLGLDAVWYAFPAAEIFSLAASIFLFVRLSRTTLRTLEPQNCQQV